MTNGANITVDAIALQERDEFRASGWLKLIAPAKVNLHLAIGNRREDGYHDATSIMHALMLHDIVYMRRQESGIRTCTVRMVGCGDVEAPVVEPANNLAVKAVLALAEACSIPPSDAALELRIEKNIPAQGGLGGGSTDAAAALVGAATLWGIPLDDPRIEETARKLGADVAFFLHGGCSSYTGAGDVFVRNLEPSKQAVALIKPAGGVSTAAAYTTFDSNPAPIPAETAENARLAQRASDLVLFNNLAPAAEQLMPELANVRIWAAEQLGSEGVLLCGSGATTFVVCSDFSTATRMVADARALGWWARATSFGSARAMVISTGDASGTLRSASR